MVIEVGINKMQLAKVAIMKTAAIHPPVADVVFRVIPRLIPSNSALDRTNTINKKTLTRVVEVSIPLLKGVLSFIIIGLSF